MKHLLAATALFLSADAALAANELACTQVEDLLWTIDEIEEEGSESSRINKMAITRLSTRAMQALGTARAFSEDGTFPAEIIRGLETIRDSLRAGADGPDMPFEEARSRILESGIAIGAAMPAACPAADLPDLASYLD